MFWDSDRVVSLGNAQETLTPEFWYPTYETPRHWLFTDFVVD
jgi:hypothetical protein